MFIYRHKSERGFSNASLTHLMRQCMKHHLPMLFSIGKHSLIRAECYCGQFLLYIIIQRHKSLHIKSYFYQTAAQMSCNQATEKWYYEIMLRITWTEHLSLKEVIEKMETIFFLWQFPFGTLASMAFHNFVSFVFLN